MTEYRFIQQLDSKVHLRPRPRFRRPPPHVLVLFLPSRGRGRDNTIFTGVTILYSRV